MSTGGFHQPDVSPCSATLFTPLIFFIVLIPLSPRIHIWKLIYIIKFSQSCVFCLLFGDTDVISLCSPACICAQTTGGQGGAYGGARAAAGAACDAGRAVGVSHTAISGIFAVDKVAR